MNDVPGRRALSLPAFAAEHALREDVGDLDGRARLLSLARGSTCLRSDFAPVSACRTHDGMARRCCGLCRRATDPRAAKSFDLVSTPTLGALFGGLLWLERRRPLRRRAQPQFHRLARLADQLRRDPAVVPHTQTSVGEHGIL